MDELRTALKQAFSDVFQLYVECHIFHWNVEGPDFFAYHTLFETIYKDVYDSLDPLAERIRTVGAYAPTSLQAITSSSTNTETPAMTSPSEMVTRLLATNALAITSITKALNLATSHNKQGVVNFLADRIDQHMKWNWFLRASSREIK